MPLYDLVEPGRELPSRRIFWDGFKGLQGGFTLDKAILLVAGIMAVDILTRKMIAVYPATGPVKPLGNFIRSHSGRAIS